MKVNTNKIRILQVGMTQAEFAEKAGLSRQGYNAILTKGSCSPESLVKIAKALKIKPSEILERE